VEQGVNPRDFARLEEQMPDLFAAIRKDLRENPLFRVFEIFQAPWIYQLENECVEYFESVIPHLFDKVQILLNRNLVTDLSDDRRKRYAMSEELVDYLTGEPTAAGAIEPAQICLFRKADNVWTLIFEGKTVYIRDLDGLGYICELLRTPNVRIDAAQLAGESTDSSNLTALPGLPLADAKAINAVREALSDRKEELASLPKGELARSDELEREIAQLDEYLGQVEDHRGQTRMVAGTAERARTKVTNAINRAIASISEVHPALASHLDGAITRGTTLIYAPENPPAWVF
jgi:hypothetical protein